MCDYLSAPASLARIMDSAISGAVKFSLAALQGLLCDSPFLPASALQPDPQIPPGPLFLPLVFTVNTPLEGIRGEPSTCCISGGIKAAERNQSPSEQVESSSFRLCRTGSTHAPKWATCTRFSTGTSWVDKDFYSLFLLINFFFRFSGKLDISN